MKGIIKSSAVLIAAMGVVLMATPTEIVAQSILNKIKDRAGQTATQKVLSETDKAVSKGIDNMIESATSTGQGGQQAEDGSVANTGTPTTVEADTTSNKTATIQSFSKYDFVPGDSVIYANDFAGEAIGELPSGWNSNGNSVMVTLEGLPGQWLRMAQGTLVLTDNERVFGTDFTVEFDMVLQIDFKGWMPPSFRFGLLASGAESSTANKFLSDPKGDKALYVDIAALSDAGNLMLESYEKFTRYFNITPTRNPVVKGWYGRVVRVAIQGQKERLRIWVDGEKLYDVPKGIPKSGDFNQLFFQLGSSPYQDEQIGVFVSDIKVAKGLPDTRHKLIEEGKFSTTGILFDTGSATIKPESAGVLKAIADILKQHADIRVSIIGHTDAVGDREANQVLSEHRALAVKQRLESEYGIAANRLETAGKGASQPVGDNQTAEGRTQNRRVEFIKLSK